MNFITKLFTSFLFIFLTLANSFSDATEQSIIDKEIFVGVNGAQIFCRVMGNGNPIIVIHGGPGLSQDYLLPHMATLAESNLVIFYDQRGCGLSTGEVNADSIRIEVFLDDLESIRKTFGFKKITVLGHSWGGFLAMQYALTYPEAVEKLILMNTMPASHEGWSLFHKEQLQRLAPYQHELKAIRESKNFMQGDPVTIESYYRMIYRTYCYNPENADLINLQKSPKASYNGWKIYEIFHQNVISRPFNFHDQLKQLNIPAIIVHGDVDPIPSLTAVKINESISDSKYFLIENCGHFPYVEAPDVLFKNLNDFLHSD